jgi:hypothetical protein
VQVRPAIRRISGRDVEFADGQLEGFDAIVLATGYKSNVPFWLKVPNCFTVALDTSTVYCGECHIGVALFPPLKSTKLNLTM